MIPLYNIAGAPRLVEYRNPIFGASLSKNEDYVISLNNDYLGLLSLSTFLKNIDGLIFSSGQRYITDPDLYGLPGFTRNTELMITKQIIQTLLPSEGLK